VSAKKKAAAKRKAAPTKKRAVAKKKAVTAKKPLPKRKSPESFRARRVSVGFTVGNLQKSIAWYRNTLGFTVGEMWKDDKGQVRGGELLAGSARLFLGQDDWAKGRERKKGEGFRLHLATAQDVDAIAAGIKKSGGRLDSEPATMPWGSRSFALTDPDGFKITISSES
jgi:uncharacterized glyoxalase superfamily protein PhnB